MSRIGISFDAVKQAALKLLMQGEAPSVQKIREQLGTGSHTTIALHLKAWREEYAQKMPHYLPAHLPPELIASMEVLWQTASEQAAQQFTALKQTLEVEREKLQSTQKETDKILADLQQQLKNAVSEITSQKAEKERIEIEKAVIAERLTQQEELLTNRETQYEARLKRAYAENDELKTQCQELQAAIGSLQKNAVTDAERHQQRLSEERALQQQSESRWLLMIDQARQEGKEAKKAAEKRVAENNEKILAIKNTFTETQKNLHESEAKLKIALAEIDHLKKDNQAWESKYKEMQTMQKLDKKSGNAKFKKVVEPQDH